MAKVNIDKVNIVNPTLGVILTESGRERLCFPSHATWAAVSYTVAATKLHDDALHSIGVFIKNLRPALPGAARTTAEGAWPRQWLR